MKRLRAWGLAAVLFACALAGHAQFVGPYVSIIGTLSTANGTAAKNATLTLHPSQVMFIGGTQTVVSDGQCSTDVTGQIFGLPTPVSGPRVTAQAGVGTLPAGTYYVVFAWYDQFGGVTLVSPEVSKQLGSTGELQILPPVGSGPPTATGMSVYIGNSPGLETLQGQTTGTTTQYTQAAALTAGAARPIVNNTTCRVVANDAGWPTGTGYLPTLVDASGNVLFNYTQMWQFLGPGSTYNLANGLPYYNGNVIYPFPVLTIPLNHNPQSISGPLSMTGFNLYDVNLLGVGTSVPAWGVDVEGTGLGGMVNAQGGYLIGGAAPTTNYCAGSSDGVAIDAYLPCALTSSLFYQTVASSGVPVTQQGQLSFGTGFTLGNTLGPPGKTTVNLTFRVAATTGIFTTCTMSANSSTDVSCVGTQSWSNSITGSYLTICMPYQNGFAGGPDSTGMTRAVMGIAAMTNTTFTYWTSSLQSGAAGASEQAYCVAIQ